MLSIFKRYKLSELLGFIFYKIVFSHFPVNKKKVFFEAYWGDSYSCNPKAISSYLNSNYPENKIVWSLNRPEMSPFGIKRYSFVYYYHLATSKYFVVNTNLPNFFVKKSEMIHVQTKHGTPLKLMGLDELNFKNKIRDIQCFNLRCSRWDYVISSNPYSSSIWRNAFPFDYELLEYGYPRNDFLVDNKNNVDLANKIKSEIGITDDRKIILYMPTVRDYKWDCNPYLDINLCVDYLADDYIILSRFHYLTDDKLEKSSSDIHDVSRYHTVENLYLVADLLVTDYSSAIFDYSVLGKPVVLYLSDYAEYTERRGIYFDIKSEPPGLIVEDHTSFIHAISSGKFQHEEYENRLVEFQKKFTCWDTGKATEYVCKVVFK